MYGSKNIAKRSASLHFGQMHTWPARFICLEPLSEFTHTPEVSAFAHPDLDAAACLRAPGVSNMLSILSIVLAWAFAQQGLGQGTIGFGNKRSELTPVIEGDIEFVQCEFCSLAAKHLHRSIVMMKAAMPSWIKKLPEEAVDAFLDRVCNSNQETGEWLTKMDVQQQGDALVIKQMPEVRHQQHWFRCSLRM